MTRAMNQQRRSVARHGLLYNSALHTYNVTHHTTIGPGLEPSSSSLSLLGTSKGGVKHPNSW